MARKRKPVPHGRVRTLVLALLTPLATLNASQTLTFCVGHDGRIAVELLIQDRCACELRPSGTDTPPAGMTTGPHGLDEAGLRCTDLPIPGGTADDRVKSNSSPKQRHQRAVAFGEVTGLSDPGLLCTTPAATPDGRDLIGQFRLACVAYRNSLDSVLLQV